MRTIWKFELDIADTQIITVPAYSTVLSVSSQNNKPVMWCLVHDGEEEDMYNPAEDKIVLQMVGTGHKIDNPDVVGDNFIGTIKLFEDSLILHVFIV